MTLEYHHLTLHLNSNIRLNRHLHWVAPGTALASGGLTREERLDTPSGNSESDCAAPENALAVSDLRSGVRMGGRMHHEVAARVSHSLSSVNSITNSHVNVRRTFFQDPPDDKARVEAFNQT
jgi:hypothetical protein